MHFAAASQREEGSASPSVELGDVFRLFGDEFRSKHSLSLQQLRAMRAVEICRTEELGGHIYRCGDKHCGFEQAVYNSCRNRHCPKCQTMAKAKWLEERMAELLPVAYFHAVFTLPHELNSIAHCNKKLFFDLLFAATAKTMREFARNELKGELGFLAVLHTWDQLLFEHHHLHLLVPGGALSFDQRSWNSVGNEYLFNTNALAIVFRAKLLISLKKAYANGKFEFHGQAQAFGQAKGFQNLMDKLFQKNWMVYAKKPFAGPQKVLDYLARYVHRVAISNNRILGIEEGKITFAYRDRRDGNKKKVKSLDAEEFIRRFLLHVLPDNFVRIRSFGFLANSVKKKNLALCRKLLNLPTPAKPEKKTPMERLTALSGEDPLLCPKCKKGRLEIAREIERPKFRICKWTKRIEAPDTS